MAYVLPWRRPRNKIGDEQFGDELDMFRKKELVKFLQDNPGFHWKDKIQEKDIPINYLEIGVFRGENIIGMSKTYCKHLESKMYCVDPWIDYDEYSEYKGKLGIIYNLFVEAMNKENLWDKIVVHRDFSHNVVPTFNDDFFDIVFIDGNHETDFVYKDGVMVLPKVKSGGTIIFDDYDWPQTKIGIDKFIEEYKYQLTNLRHTPYQMFVDKL